MKLIVIESISNRLAEEQGADLFELGATGGGYWLIEESDDGKEWTLLARFVSDEKAVDFAAKNGCELIREES